MIQGSYQLKAGTRYIIEVSGTMDSTNTNGGYGYRYDALYCVTGVGFDHEEQCEKVRREPANRTYRSSDFKLSSGSVTDDWRLADQFLTNSKPAQDTPAVDYDPNHSYTLGLYPPADGPIKAQTFYAATSGCPSCTNSTTGTFTVKVFGEPPPTTTPPPQPSSPCSGLAAFMAQVKPCSFNGGCTVCAFGPNFEKLAPPPGKPVDIGVKFGPGVKEAFLEAGITDAATQQVIATLIVKARQKRLRDLADGCLVMNGGNLASAAVGAISGRLTRSNPLVIACSKLIADEAERAGDARVASGRAIAVSARRVPLLYSRATEAPAEREAQPSGRRRPARRPGRRLHEQRRHPRRHASSAKPKTGAAYICGRERAGADRPVAPSPRPRPPARGCRSAGASRSAARCPAHPRAGCRDPWSTSHSPKPTLHPSPRVITAPSRR